MNLRILIPLTVLAVLAAGCTSNTPGATEKPIAPTLVSTGGSGDLATAAVSNGNGGTGGVVRDVTATVPTFTSNNTASIDNSGGNPLYFSGTIADANGEADLAFLWVRGTTFNVTNGVQTLGANHTVTAAEQAASSEPAAYGADGYKVWNCGARDGILCWKYQLLVGQFAQSGTYTFNVTTGKNASVIQSAASLVQTAVVTSFSQIDFAPYPVDASGATQTGANWGAWAANPGDTNVVAGNYLKLTNNGDVANARVQVSFSGTSFVGATDPSWTVPFANNIQMRFCDALIGTAPSACAFGAWTGANAGSAVVTFAGKAHVVYVQYQVVQLPATLPAQSYGATFTATEL